jgi:phosphomannomutase
VTEQLAEIKFGTDGWRAVIAREFTFANLERVAQAYASFLISEHQQTSKEALVIVGFDRRFLSEHFAQRAAEVVAGNGFRVAVFSEAQPTPLISWAVRDLKALGGIVITASHNPPTFNGFKIKAPWGGSAAPETTAAVEKLVDVTTSKHAELKTRCDELLEPAVTTYRKQIANLVDLHQLKHSSGNVMIDPMHGSGGKWVETFLSGGNLNVQTIRSNRDCLFGGVNPEPIDQNLASLKEAVMGSRALVGLATDGDADRVGAVDELGQTMTMHDVVPLLLLHLARERKMTGAVVVTVSQSVLTKRIAEAMGLKLFETPIGFKYIADLMLTDDVLIGAEESGGIGVKGHIPERDGILNSLLFLESIVKSDKPPSEMLADLHREFGEFRFGRRDLHMPVSRGQELVARLSERPPSKIGDFEVTGVNTLDGAKVLFADESWLLFRQSGTEPVLRIYSEATSFEKRDSLLDAGVAMALRT